MEQNFNLLLDNILDVLDTSDLRAIKQQLDSIKGNTVLVGAGGSSVVANFAQKVLNGNSVLSTRDLNYMNIENINNIVVFSYSGKGYVIENLLDKNRQVYVFTNGVNNYQNVINIMYDTTMEKCKSFISLASTLMPMAILYYYSSKLNLTKFKNKIIDMFNSVTDFNIKNNNVYEILTGYDTSSASKYLESTMVESAIAIPVIHDKYDYCHGRTTLSYKNNHGLIMFNSNTEFDHVLLEELYKYYTEVIVIDQYQQGINVIDNDFYATICAMYLTKKLAENKEIDLSYIDYSPMVKKLYYFKGEM